MMCPYEIEVLQNLLLFLGNLDLKSAGRGYEGIYRTPCLFHRIGFIKYVRTCNMNRYLIGEAKRVWQEIAAMRKAKNNHEWGWDDWLAEISNHFLRLGLSMRTIDQYTNIPEAQDFFEKEV